MTQGDGLDDLRAELRRRRLASLDTSDPVRQTRVAEVIGVRPNQVSRLETGERSIRNLSGEQVWGFLRGYGFSGSEVRRAVETYSLSIPPQFVDGTAPPGMVTVLHEGSVSKPSEPEPRVMHDQTGGRYDPEHMRVRDVEPGDLLTEAAKAIAPVGATLWLHDDKPPAPGKTAIVEQDGRQALVVWPLPEPRYALPVEPRGEAPLLLHPDKLTFKRRVIGIFIPQ